MDPIPPTSGSDTQQGASGNEPARSFSSSVPPPTPLGKPVSRGVAAVVAIALAGIAALAWLDARSGAEALRSEMTKRLVDEEAALAQAKARDSDQTGELREAHAKLALVETRMAELQAQQASLEAMYHDIAPSREEILLTEVEQTLLLASQQLSLAANVPAAITALQLADGRLAGTNRTQLLPLRRALARDMERLKAVPAVDVPGIAVKLDRALATIDWLPLAQDERLPEPPPAPAPRDDPPWLAFLRSLWSDAITRAHRKSDRPRRRSCLRRSNISCARTCACACWPHAWPFSRAMKPASSPISPRPMPGSRSISTPAPNPCRRSWRH
jgi:uncharacterized protein HemX